MGYGVGEGSALRVIASEPQLVARGGNVDEQIASMRRKFEIGANDSRAEPQDIIGGNTAAITTAVTATCIFATVIISSGDLVAISVLYCESAVTGIEQVEITAGAAKHNIAARPGMDYVITIPGRSDRIAAPRRRHR